MKFEIGILNYGVVILFKLCLPHVLRFFSSWKFIITYLVKLPKIRVFTVIGSLKVGKNIVYFLFPRNYINIVSWCEDSFFDYSVIYIINIFVRICEHSRHKGQEHKMLLVLSRMLKCITLVNMKHNITNEIIFF